MQLVGQEKREAEALKLLHEEQSKKQGQELLEQYLAYKKEAEDAEGNGKKKRKEKDPLKPKHPTTAFFAFCNSRRPALLEAKTRIPEIGKILGEEWKALSDAKRVPFEKIAATEKTRYAAELEAYKVSKAEVKRRYIMWSGYDSSSFHNRFLKKCGCFVMKKLV
jgi:upstream-binding transcription factor